jgi:rare lipoprotein A
MKGMHIFLAIVLLFSAKLLSAQTKIELSGKATYYSDRYQGRFTSSGERYDVNKFTCAHASLPFGTWLKVTSLVNNKYVIVKVNDRCAYNKRLTLDLSRRAARELDLLVAGVANVKIESVSDTVGLAWVNEKMSNNKIVPAANPPQLACGFYDKEFKTSAPKGFGVQVTSLKNQDILSKELEAYDLKYHEAINVRVKYFKLQKFHVVILGEFASRKDAEVLQSKLISDFSDCLVVRFDEL